MKVVPKTDTWTTLKDPNEVLEFDQPLTFKVGKKQFVKLVPTIPIRAKVIDILRFIG